jgi:hypothetical protein
MRERVEYTLKSCSPGKSGFNVNTLALSGIGGGFVLKKISSRN